VRIVQLSDIHVWQYVYNPLKLLSKRAVGMFELLTGRAQKFRLERLSAVVERVRELEPDHVLITGDLTTTALQAEFTEARRELEGLLTDPARATVIPGNHDRYTIRAWRRGLFEQTFGAFAPGAYPWLKPLDDETAILGLDATRTHHSARGRLPQQQLDDAWALMADRRTRPGRLIVACHYPLVAPPAYTRELAIKRLSNADQVRAWLSGLGPHLYCCGHVHAAWAYRPPDWPDHLSLNSGAPLLRDPTGQRPPGFFEIELTDQTVSVTHHAWTGSQWSIFPLVQGLRFFRPPTVPAPTAGPAASTRLDAGA